MLVPKKGGRRVDCLRRRIPPVFMIHSRFGVTRRWYRQFSLLLLHHYASFEGEARVHKNGVLSVSRVANGLRKAWFLLRILERMWERGADDSGIRLDSSIENTLAEQFRYYYSAMRRHTQESSVSLGIDTSFQVLDGHCKLTRRVRCCKRICRIECSGLGAFALVGCPATPLVATRPSKRARAGPDAEGASALCAVHRLLHRSDGAADIHQLS